jgi:formate dehydrogenase gamma subunit
MSKLERMQHASLLLSFFLLVFTGFMLRFPDAWWVEGIRSLWKSAFEARSIVHRIAAVWMCAASLFHLVYVVATARGRALIKDFLPKLSDLREFRLSAMYLAGLTHERPRFGRCSYIEKAEYWALVWGTMVMAATGFIMWFDNTFLGILGKLGYDVARTVHYYEAWLASLAILVWHVYFVMFNPDVYPMNTAWITGTLSEKEMRDEHPRELDEILKAKETPED